MPPNAVMPTALDADAVATKRTQRKRKRSWFKTKTFLFVSPPLAKNPHLKLSPNSLRIQPKLKRRLAQIDHSFSPNRLRTSFKA
jgi:hypothetical protein